MLLTLVADPVSFLEDITGPERCRLRNLVKLLDHVHQAWTGHPPARPLTP